MRITLNYLTQNAYHIFIRHLYGNSVNFHSVSYGLKRNQKSIEKILKINLISKNPYFFNK